MSEIIEDENNQKSVDLNSKLMKSNIDNITNINKPFFSAMSLMQNQINETQKLKLITSMFTNSNSINQLNNLTQNLNLTTQNLQKQINWYDLIVRKTDVYKQMNVADFGMKSNLIYPFYSINQKSKSINESYQKFENLRFYNPSDSYGLDKKLTIDKYTEKSISNLNLENLGNKIGLDYKSKKNISSSFFNLSTNYANLIKSFEINPNLNVEINPKLTELASEELYNGANLLEIISKDEEFTSEEEVLKSVIQFENEFSLNKYLPLINPGLWSMWKGAIECFKSNNSDKVRQFITSIRELFTHLFNLLAPKEQIRLWTNDEKFYHQGNPTRKCKLHYICRNISNNSFGKFIEKDVEATLEFIDLFQKGTHSIDNDFSQSQLIAIKSKAEATLKFIVEIEFSSNK